MNRYRLLACAGLAAAIAAAPIAVTRNAPASQKCWGAIATGVRNGHVVCVHASERPPPGVDPMRKPSTDELKERRYGESKRPPEVAATASEATVQAASSGSIACIGDGVSGNRVQAIYARASNTTDRYNSVLSLIGQYAADTDYHVNVSAGQSGSGRRVRFVTSNCALSVLKVTLSPTGDDSFQNMRSELWAKGLNSPTRKYLVWMDAAIGICGLGEMYGDDSDSTGNANNNGPTYARVDTPCWGYAEAHELLHTLGGVQDSAPHSTLAGHCVDENDTMCYVDTSGKNLENDCPSMPSWQVDCRLDDYFNAKPAPGSYLDTHWNVANSSFLEGTASLPPAPSITLSMPTAFYAGVTAQVKAYVSVPPGRTFTVSWSSTRVECRFTSPTAASNLFYCPVKSIGSGQVTATVTDSLGMSSSSSRNYTLAVPSKQRATILYLGLPTTLVSKGGPTPVYGKLVDAASGTPIIGMPIAVYVRGLTSSTWTKLVVHTTNQYGDIGTLTKPTAATVFILVSGYSATWNDDQSSSKVVAVI